MSIARKAAALGGLLAVALHMTCPVTSASASAPPQLRLVGTSTSGLQVNVLAAVPPELANHALPPSAFSMQERGRPLPITVRRVSDAGLDLYVVVDTTGTTTNVAWHKSAAADLLRMLPTTVRTSVATGNVPEPQQGNSVALRTLAAVEPGSDLVVDTTLNRIASVTNTGRKRLIILMTSCPQDSSTDLTPLKTALNGATNQLNIVGFSSGCRSRLLPMARDHGGLTLSATVATQLVAAVDTIGHDTLGQYWLSVPARATATPVVVTVDFAGIHAAIHVVLPTAGKRQPAGGSSNPTPASEQPAGAAPAVDWRESRLPAGLTTVPAGLLLLVLVALLVIGRAARLRPSGEAKFGGSRSLTSRLLRVRKPKRPSPSRLVTGAVESIPLADQISRTKARPSVPAPQSGAAAPEPLLGKRHSGDEALDPFEAAGAHRDLGLKLPPAGLSDGSVRVRLPRGEDAEALREFADKVGGLDGIWVPPQRHGSRPDHEAVIESWSRAWRSENPHAWPWPVSSSAGLRPVSPAGAAQRVTPARSTGPRSGLGLVVEHAEDHEMIGYIGLQEKPHAVEVSYGSAPRYIGHDYARRGVRLVADWLGQEETVRQVETVILSSDTVSRSVARDVGFLPTGTVWTFLPTTGTMALSVRFVFNPGGEQGNAGG